MITYQQENTPEACKDIEEALEGQWGEDQWGEVGLNAVCTQDISMEVDYEMYRKLLDAGILRIFTVRDNDKLVGYYLSTVMTDLGSKHVVVAQNDTLYLKEEYRKGWVGYKFIRYAVEELKKIADIVLIDMNTHKTFFSLTERLGFKLVSHRVMLEV